MLNRSAEPPDSTSVLEDWPGKFDRPLDKSAYWKTIFFISHPIDETVLLITQNIRLNWWIR